MPQFVPIGGKRARPSYPLSISKSLHRGFKRNLHSQALWTLHVSKATPIAQHSPTKNSLRVWLFRSKCPLKLEKGCTDMEEVFTLILICSSESGFIAINRDSQVCKEIPQVKGRKGTWVTDTPSWTIAPEPVRPRESLSPLLPAECELANEGTGTRWFLAPVSGAGFWIGVQQHLGFHTWRCPLFPLGMRANGQPHPLLSGMTMPQKLDQTTRNSRQVSAQLKGRKISLA